MKLSKMLNGSMFDGEMRGERYDQMLDRMGLQRKSGSSSGMMSSLGLFGMGLVVGTAMGMLFAPKRGEELRSQAKHKIPGMKRSEMSGQDQIYEQRA